jgi:hypothetical protein
MLLAPIGVRLPHVKEGSIGIRFKGPPLVDVVEELAGVGLAQRGDEPLGFLDRIIPRKGNGKIAFLENQRPNPEVVFHLVRPSSVFSAKIQDMSIVAEQFFFSAYDLAAQDEVSVARQVRID